MKRLRGDVYDTPPFKRSFYSSHGKSYDNVRDVLGALHYLREIKDTFPDQMEKYEIFLDVMKDFKARRIDITGVKEKVKELFKEHPSLLLGFNPFVPNLFYEKGLNDEDKAPPKKITFKEQEHIRSCASRIDTVVAVSYLREVRGMLFPNEKEKYDKFLYVIKEFKARRIDAVGVIARVKKLFKGHLSLLLGFNAFVPNGYEIIIDDEDRDPSMKTTFKEQALNLVNKVKKHLGNDHEYKSFVDIMKECRNGRKDVKDVYHEVAVLLNDSPDLLDEFSRYFPNSVIYNPLSTLDEDKKLMK